MNTMNIHEDLSFKDIAKSETHGLRGRVRIYRRNKTTKETSLWYDGENVVTLSGYQFILTKILNLFLDSSHGHSYDRPGKDTTLVTPDLNETDSGMGIGVDPASYTEMDENISSNHFIQGFMVGNGGAGEDTITSKNTNYSFKKLRNPIPFQQTQSQTGLPAGLAGKYCGVLRTGTSMKSYFIKKFDETPHIYHSWWRDGQDWDERHPITPGQLGPDAREGAETDRIETYAECVLTIDESDFVSYFNNAGASQSTAMINELGLVAFDAKSGERSKLIDLYHQQITYLLHLVFDKSKDSLTGDDRTEYITTIQELADSIYNILQPLELDDSHIATFINVLEELQTATSYADIRNELCDPGCIEVEALYNQNDTLQYTTDKFLEYLDLVSFSEDDEAQRIKLITYYTFNSIPVDANFELIINYRLYAN